MIDASIVRVLPVPAAMRLLGRANWWAPGPLRPVYARYGIRAGERAPAQPCTAEPVAAQAEPVAAQAEPVAT